MLVVMCDDAVCCVIKVVIHFFISTPVDITAYLFAYTIWSCQRQATIFSHFCVSFPLRRWKYIIVSCDYLLLQDVHTIAVDIVPIVRNTLLGTIPSTAHTINNNYCISRHTTKILNIQ